MTNYKNFRVPKEVERFGETKENDQDLLDSGQISINDTPELGEQDPFITSEKKHMSLDDEDSHRALPTDPFIAKITPRYRYTYSSCK